MATEDPGKRVLRDLGYDEKGRYRPGKNGMIEAAVKMIESGEVRVPRSYFDMGRNVWDRVEETICGAMGVPGGFVDFVVFNDPTESAASAQERLDAFNARYGGRTARWTRADRERDLDESIINGSGHEANGIFNEVELKRASDGSFRRGGDALGEGE